jgi:hypothetical protein
LIAHRALGRSDPAHLLILNFPNLVFCSLLLYEGLRFLAHRGLRSPWTDRRVWAFAVMAWSCWQIPHGRLSPLDVLRWVRSVREEVDSELPRSSFVLERVGLDDDLWEMEDGMMSYVYHRHNPTRHTITYTISSVGEQRLAVAALRARAPKLIAWQFLSGADMIADPLRYHVIAQHLYGHFRPILGNDGAAYLEPAPSGWPGQVELEPRFLGELALGQLALRWGNDRIPTLAERVRKRQRLGPWLSEQDVGDPGAEHAMARARTWKAEGRIDCRTLNYLRLDLACGTAGFPRSRQVDAALEFAPSGCSFEDRSRVSFAIVPDGAVRPYLIPIGCSPGWSWRPGIDRVRVSVPVGFALSLPRAECWQVID